ncbi:MAG: UbiX family flavin prenyltransferase [Fimbriimonadaceae bacterium]|nr:UbiX family flavin prenyltransferase [Fimbriimonadaceae bacterium]QYK55601.1 MAG: UbiX family flavin prenyltransferase [Fimbriimonadaceae bacterium]
MKTGKLVVAVTGASGAIYAQRFLRQAARAFDHVYLTVSAQAVDVAATELGVTIDRQNFSTEPWLGETYRNVHLLDERDYFTPPASGSFRHDGMVILPCSMGTAGRIANGISNDLTTRAADVCLKERRPLVLVPREMPWNLIMLRNLTALAEAGATVLPASPAWYTRPGSLEDLADTVVARVLQVLGVEQTLVDQWMVEQ